MNRSYGVTMAERGVSRLVSLNLEVAVRFREAS
jgi:chromosome segregation ATPase